MRTSHRDSDVAEKVLETDQGCHRNGNRDREVSLVGQRQANASRRHNENGSQQQDGAWATGGPFPSGRMAIGECQLGAEVRRLSVRRKINTAYVTEKEPNAGADRLCATMMTARTLDRLDIPGQQARWRPS